MTFRVGMKVVCVNAAPDEGRFLLDGERPLIEGDVYTISGFPVPLGYHAEPVVSLLEQPRPDGAGWRVGRFRPAVEPKQEVSFTTGAPIDSERYDNRRPVVEPMPVDGWRVSVKT